MAENDGPVGVMGRPLGLAQQEWEYEPSGHPNGLDFDT